MVAHPRQLQKRPADQPRVLSFASESLWYLERLTPNSPVYNVPFLCRLRGRLDLEAFRKALNALVDRQAVLRTVFLTSKGSPVPYVVKKRPVELKNVELRHLPDCEREAEARRLARQEAARPFNLSRDPMFRPFLFRLGDEEYMFLFVTHHIAFELGSLAVLYRDIDCLYNAFVAGRTPHPPEMAFDESDFALWQRQTLVGERLEALSKYWRERLQGAPLLELPLDFPRPRVHSHRGVRRFFTFAPELASSSTALFLKLGSTPYRGLLAAFNVLLYCYSGLTDICVGSPFASRCAGIEHTIGFFANTLVLRTDLSGDPTFRELVKRVDRIVLRAIANADLGFEKIVEAVQPPRDPSRTPLVQVSFRGRMQPYASLQLDDLECSIPEFIDNGTAKFDLALELEASTGQACFFEYSSDLFREETIVQMEQDFHTILRGLVADPDRQLSQIAAVEEVRQRIERRAERELASRPLSGSAVSV